MSKVTVEPNTKRVIIEEVSDEMINSFFANAAAEMRKFIIGTATPPTTLDKIAPGTAVKAGKFEIIVLEHLEEGTAILFKDSLEERRKFDSNSGNWISSDLRNYLNTDFYKSLSAEIGEENIVEHTVDLTTVEGSKRFGTVQDKVSLLTCHQFSKYHDILEKFKLDNWWWLCTPIDVPNYENCARAVLGIGIVRFRHCFYGGGVRPFCILKSNIFVSKVEE